MNINLHHFFARRRRAFDVITLIGVATLTSSLPTLSFAQEAQAGIDEVVVTGSRGTIQGSIATKRESDTVVDALSASEIGELPALSIGEALENLTGASSHREQGGATEISIRGMGPFLGSNVMNGREATNGSGDRSVNFSQFPSELFNKVAIYKTQEASLIEGGVSGQIALSTMRPLDYGKRRTQISIKGGYNPSNANIDPNEGDIKYRTTLSTVHQFESESMGSFGFSLGMQNNDATNPEAEYRSTSDFGTCLNDASLTEGMSRTSSGNCNSSSSEVQAQAYDGTPSVFTSSSRRFRQNTTDDARDSVFAAFQWQPNDKWDINLDVQQSDRTFTEKRHDLVFAEMRRVAAGSTDPYYNTLGSTGGVDNFQTNGPVITQFRNFGRVETNSEYIERIEEYDGGGLTFEYAYSDLLSLSVDASVSKTMRQENIWGVRLQSESTNIGNVARLNADGSSSTDRPFAIHDLSYTNADVNLVTIENFDVTNHDLFADSARSRIDLNQMREHEIKALRGDFEFITPTWGSITSIEGGIRYSEMEFESFPRSRTEMSHSDEALDAANVACRVDFPEADFLSEQANGNNLVTNVDVNGNVIASGTGRSYAAFDTLCLVDELYATSTPGEAAPGTPEPTLANIQNLNVTEDTVAAYVQFNFESDWGSYPVRGNFGARVVNTDVNSIGYRNEFTLDDADPLDPDNTVTLVALADTLVTQSGGGSYTEVLPSFNLVADLNEQTIFRFGAYRGMSRPDPDALGFGRSLNINSDGTETSIDDFTGRATSLGNPLLQPLMSWNFDMALEHYLNDDTMFAFGVYTKNFQGGFGVTQQSEDFVIDGVTFPAVVSTSQTSSETSSIKGLEITATHSFDYLPGLWRGFGFKLSYNRATSDFEFEDHRMGDLTVIDGSGNLVEQSGIIPPAELFGFSEQVSSAQLYYQIGDIDLSLINKKRSDYFQQFVSSPGTIRLIDDTDVWEFKARYKVTSNLTLRFEGINIFDEPKTQFNPTSDHLAEINSYGPRYYLGLTAKF
jgi:iron complex outermembrane receptor protein